MLALARWRPYLVGQKFELHTDHQPLVYLQSQPRLSCRNARWLDELAAYDVAFVHVPGKAHVAADALSRVPDGARCSFRCSCCCILPYVWEIARGFRMVFETQSCRSCVLVLQRTVL